MSVKNFEDFGALPAVLGPGTVSASGTAVTGSSTTFTTSFSVNDLITVFPPQTSGSGYITTGPIPVNCYDNSCNVEDPTGSLVFGIGTTFTNLNPGDQIYIPIYGSYPNGQYAFVQKVISSTLLRTQHMLYPQVGNGYPYAYIIVRAGTCYVIGNTPHGLHDGDTVVISGSGSAWNTGLNGSFTIPAGGAAYNLPFGTAFATSFQIPNTNSVGDDTYFSDSISITKSGSPIMAVPAVSAVVSGGVATLKFLRWHGFTPGDAIHISGFTGGGSGLNGASTVATVGTGDWPVTLTISTGVSPGTYNTDLGAVAASAWYYVPQPQQRTVSSITNNTALTVSAAFSPGCAAGSTYWNTPDNLAAFTSACSAAVDFEVSPKDYYIGNTGTPGVSISNFSNRITMIPGGRFVLTDPLKGGFYFTGGKGAEFNNWRVDGLYSAPPPSGVSLGAFQCTLYIIQADRPRVNNFVTRCGLGNALDIEFCSYPIVNGVDVTFCAGAVVLNANKGGELLNVNAVTGYDFMIGLYNNNSSDMDLRGLVVSNINLKNPWGGIILQNSKDYVISNAYIEGAQIGSVICEDTSYRVKLSNIEIQNAGTLGPGSQLLGGIAAVLLANAADFELCNLSIYNVQTGLGVYASSPGFAGSVSLNNVKIVNTQDIGIGMNAGTSVSLSNVYIERSGGQGFAANFVGTVEIDNLTLRDVGQNTLANYNIAKQVLYNFQFAGNGNTLIIKGLTIIDDQNPPTSESIQVAAGIVGRVSGLVVQIQHPVNPADPLTLYNTNSPSKVFVAGWYDATVVASAGTIVPASDTFSVNGTTTISTITIPAGMQPGDKLYLIPTGLWATNAAGNIGLASSAIVGKVLVMTWDGSKLWPSY